MKTKIEINVFEFFKSGGGISSNSITLFCFMIEERQKDILL